MSNVMLTDLYQLTMMQGYYKCGIHQNTAVFDMYYRDAEHRYSVFAGLSQLVEFATNIRFLKSDIEYLRTLELFEEDFLSELLSIRFDGDIFSVQEGEIVFANQPLIKVVAPLWQGQFLESTLLNIVNHQCLVASRASRIVHQAGAGRVIEFGLRRAHGMQAGMGASRASIIGGCCATSNVAAGKAYGIPIKGTHAHSWVLSFDSELEAFMAYANLYPDSCVLLLDTYDTLKSGLPNAIKTFNHLVSCGHRPIGVRIDSGDIAYLSKQIRQRLNEAGYTYVTIMASGDIDEHVVASLNAQNASVDLYGVGGKLSTGSPNPIFGGVYKLASIQNSSTTATAPRMKFGNDMVKASNPGDKQLYRIYDAKGMAFADLITLQDEQLSRPLILTHPTERYKSAVLEDYTQRSLLVPIIIKGELVCDLLSVQQANQHRKEELERFWDEYKRLHSPHLYKVNLSDRLYDLKQRMLSERLSKA